MRFAFIRAEKENYPIRALCRNLQVSPSGYYAWLKRGESERARKDRALTVEIRTVWRTHRGRYGSPRIHLDFCSRGIQVGRKRVERIMRDNNLQARPAKRYVHTTQSDHCFQRFDNLLDRKFDVENLNVVWAGDITYVATTHGWLYLAVVLDLCSRRVIGWALRDHLETSLVIEALQMALRTRHHAPRLFHSDQGTQYAANDFQDLLRAHDITPSMSRRGNCWDNAPVESFFKTLKTELDLTGCSHKQTSSQIFDYIEAYYNTRRIHSGIGNVSPVLYEQAVT